MCDAPRSAQDETASSVPPLREWSRDLEQITLDGVPFRIFRKREHAVARLLGYASRWADRTYLVQGDQRWTFDDVMEAVERRASALAAHGVSVGSPVLILGWPSIDWIVAFWAVLRAGGVVVTGNAWWSEEEVRHAIAVSRPELVLVDRDHPAERVGTLTFGELAADPATTRLEEPPLDEEHLAVAMFTSGTTGLPKAAVFTQRAIIAGIHGQLALTQRMPLEIADDHPRQVTLQTGPLFHIGGVQAILRGPLLGSTLVLTQGRFDPEQVLMLIEREQVTRWAGVIPTMALRVIEHPTVGSYDLSSVRSLTLGGTAVSAEVMERVREIFPNARQGVKTGWGLTESGGQLTAASGAETLTRPGSVGRPLPFVDLRILDPDGAGVGEVLARSPMQMSGYLGEPSGTIIDEDGWLHTGDLGRIDDDGWVWLVGRSKDLIIRGGENIAASRVEQVLRDHDAVLDAAVLGLPDRDLGEVVAAAVVVRPGADLSEAGLAEFAAERLSRFAVPTQWWLTTESLPTNEVGKVAKNALRDTWPR